MNLGISVIGPSGSGKSSLIASHFIHTQRVLNACENPDKVHISPYDSDPDENGETSKERIDNAKDSFMRSIEQNKSSTFETLLGGTNAKTIYRFYYKFGKEYTGPNLNIEITDYPGGWLGKEEFQTEEVHESMIFSTALLVPIPADVLLFMGANGEGKDKDKGKFAKWKYCYDALKVNEVMDCVQAWIAHRVRAHLKGLLLFVPIRCEHCFSDNCNQNDKTCNDKAKKLFNLIESYYIDKLEIDDDTLSYITCTIHAVDTYGISKYYKTTEKDGAYASIFNIVATKGPKKISPKGAFEQMDTIISHGIEVILDTEQRLKNAVHAQKEQLGCWGSFLNWVKRDPLGKEEAKHNANIDELKDALLNLSKHALAESQKRGYSEYRKKDVALKVNV